MRALELFISIVSQACRNGMTKSSISELSGHDKSFVNATISHQPDNIGIEHFASVAMVCGYDLLVRNRRTGREIIIDPSYGVIPLDKDESSPYIGDDLIG